MRKLAPIVCGALCAATLALAGSAHASPGNGVRDGAHHAPATRADAEAITDKLFARLDVDGDGQLTPKDREGHEAARFARLDADGNGALSPQEFAAGGPGPRGPRAGLGADVPGKDPMGPHPEDRSPEGHGPGPMGMHGMHPGPGMIGREADKDQDGSISKAEFKDATLARFDEADADHDGSLTKAERKDARKAHRGERSDKRRALRTEWRAMRDAAGQ